MGAGAPSRMVAASRDPPSADAPVVTDGAEGAAVATTPPKGAAKAPAAPLAMSSGILGAPSPTAAPARDTAPAGVPEGTAGEALGGAPVPAEARVRPAMAATNAGGQASWPGLRRSSSEACLRNRKEATTDSTRPAGATSPATRSM